jgi:hypothetical protein
MSNKNEDNGNKESEEPDYDEDQDQLEEEQEKETGEQKQQIRFSELVSKALTQLKEQRVIIYFNSADKRTMCNVIIAKRLNQKQQSKSVEDAVMMEFLISKIGV